MAAVTGTFVLIKALLAKIKQFCKTGNQFSLRPVCCYAARNVEGDECASFLK